MVISRRFLTLGVALALILTCLTQAETIQFHALIERIEAGDEIDYTQLHLDFSEQFLDGMTLLDLEMYESQVELLTERPLRLGPLGSAILDHFRFSLPAHTAMIDFYQHVNQATTANHDIWIEHIERYMVEGRTGNEADPYRAFTVAQAMMYLNRSGSQVIGSRYGGNEDHHLLLYLVRTTDSVASDEIVFDLSSTFDQYVQLLRLSPTIPLDEQRDRVLSMLAHEGDTAAQIAIGLLNLYDREYVAARRWFSRASQANNVLADVHLGRFYLSRAADVRDRSNLTQLSRDHYQQAVEAGHSPTLREFGRLLVDGYFGNQEVSDGVVLLERATSLNDDIAFVHLAVVKVREADYEAAAQNFKQAALLGNPDAKLAYYQLLADPSAGLTVTQQSVDWVTEQADSGDVNAMVTLGDCYARGCPSKPNYRKAKRWYRTAVETDPQNHEVINQVAWTLTTSHLTRLRDTRYALKIMDELMENDEIARRVPAYIDTWAAIHAARGQFERAIELQEEVVQLISASPSISPDLLNVLQEHLKLFQNGETITEEIP